MNATAIIEVIGIVLLSYQLEPGKLIGIAPRIPCSTTHDGPARNDAPQRNAIAITKPGSEMHMVESAEQAMTHANVEEHEALLVFPRGHYNAQGWEPKPLNDSYDYVKLSGERVRFIINGGERKTERTNVGAMTNSGKGAAVVRQTGLGLPHASGFCTNPQLRREYTPETNYSLAAAVVEFPGDLGSTCHKSTGRQDTVVSFDYAGTFVVEATNALTTKRITFDSMALITIANVPVTVTDRNAKCGGDSPHLAEHLAAYAAMVLPCNNKTQPCTLSTWQGDDCPDTPLRPGGKVIVTTPWPAALVTASCSNNQWP